MRRPAWVKFTTALSTILLTYSLLCIGLSVVEGWVFSNLDDPDLPLRMAEMARELSMSFDIRIAWAAAAVLVSTYFAKESAT